MMNIYYSSNRNNIDDTNKLFYKVVISPILQNLHLYIDLIHDIIPVHSGVCGCCGSHRELCLHSAGAGGAQLDTAGDTAWLCHLHGHCGLCQAVQAQALWLVVLSARGEELTVRNDLLTLRTHSLTQF